ncbi:hypothetical protein FM038_018895 [Shewanella eurypsychrophilus]|uniref:Uncharacterized protein n=1 Tax=Shewanella eurypsychrophilus TaxID=2593656 RepID=A0ABX6VB33_9GAMM|nr:MULTISPECIES: hypothetical protein [Shewanella]QFU24014.1 hypothetical protein FS418_20640 [Shewanella sp. YLB-09]QPG59223.1 hypothetical protein FM038_018895 [Shewanella eurypsychrophilus]
MKLLTTVVLISASLLPLTASAGMSDNKPIERITVNYKTPFDYALYQYTTELLVQFRQEIASDIYLQAKASSSLMAQEHSRLAHSASIASRQMMNITDSDVSLQ